MRTEPSATRAALCRAFEAINTARNIAVVVVFSTMIVTFLLAFVSRYIPAIGSFNWADELTRFLHVWLVFLALGWVIRHGGHIAMDMVVQISPRPIRAALVAFADISFIALMLVFVVYGARMVEFNFDQEAPTLRMVAVDWLMGWPIRMGWPYLAIPVGATIAICDYVAVRFCGAHSDDVVSL